MTRRRTGEGKKKDLPHSRSSSSQSGITRKEEEGTSGVGVGVGGVDAEEKKQRNSSERPLERARRETDDDAMAGVGG
ncbi:hypothetical protein RUM44_006729 [Polyplax serrata]|uniref:Uncharacterized protein n=1 Tax=Polyplax serrata TaxID=468196 RepID=A0ABR1AJ01_POLSC